MNEERKILRQLGITLGELPAGENNAITDIPGVLVGHTTLYCGEGTLVEGKGPVRTGVTVVHPHGGNMFQDRILASTYVQNGAGALYGGVQLDEIGVLTTPIAITNTLSIGTVADGLVRYTLGQNSKCGLQDETVIPLVCECDDSFLNDIRGLHVISAHVEEAIREAKSGPVAQGNVGAGTGMATFDFKGGIGSSSRVTSDNYTVGVLVCSNFGSRRHMRIGGIPLGHNFKDCPPLPKAHREGSIVIVVGTNAPLCNRQLKRLGKRAMSGLARTGTISSHGSGDIVVTFCTAHQIPHDTEARVLNLSQVPDEHIDELFLATVEATEEAIANALFLAETMTGRDGNTLYELPIEETVALLRRRGYG